VEVLVATFVMVTLAPGTAAPEASVTRPEIEPRNSCANANELITHAIRMHINLFLTENMGRILLYCLDV
jgi:hypothetical protein